MKTLYILLLLLLAGTHTFRQPCNDYWLWYSETDSLGNERHGYKTATGEIAIPAKYMNVYTDTMYCMAIVMTADWKMVCIDRNDSILCHPFIFDNGPDYVSEGVFRIIENKKMGFADINGNIVIPPVFDFVGSFGEGYDEDKQSGIAFYEMGGYRHWWDSEHWTWLGGYESGYINHSGQRFAKVGKLKNGKRKAWTTDGKRVWLDGKGDLINANK